VALIDWDEAHVDVPDLDLVLPHNAAGLTDDVLDVAAQASAAWEAAVCWDDDHSKECLAEVRPVRGRPAAVVGRLVVITGLPGSGKTRLATQLAATMPAVRMSPDDWMMASGIDLWDAPSRIRIEHVQLTLTLDLLREGRNVVIEWGVWTRTERDALRDAARALGAPVELHHLDAPLDELWRRIETRDREGRWGARSIERHELEQWAAAYEAPTADELATYDLPVA
jgi:predicted kinase